MDDMIKRFTGFLAATGTGMILFHLIELGSLSGTTLFLLMVLALLVLLAVAVAVCVRWHRDTDASEAAFRKRYPPADVTRFPVRKQ